MAALSVEGLERDNQNSFLTIVIINILCYLFIFIKYFYVPFFSGIQHAIRFRR